VLRKIDRIIAEIIIILIISTGIFSIVASRIDSSNITYQVGIQNPFAIKKIFIDYYNNSVFAGLAIFGLLMQAIYFFCRQYLAGRLYTRKIYLVTVVVGLIFMSFLTSALSWVSSYVARSKWRPRVIAVQRTVFYDIQDVVTHRGLTTEQLSISDQVMRKLLIEINLVRIGKNLDQIDQLLDLTPGSGDYRSRLSRLEKYFK
jgi:hypothetical protein